MDIYREASVPDHWLIMTSDWFNPINYAVVAAELGDSSIDRLVVGFFLENSEGFGKSRWIGIT